MTEIADTLTLSSVVEALGRHASARGDDVAVEGARDKLTYRQLDERSTTIAHAVRDSVNGRHKPLALLIDHGVQQYAAIMGVLKSGHICLPLDTTQPELRLRQICDHAQPEAVVTDGANRDLAVRVVETEAPIIDVTNLPERHASSQDIALDGDDPALILYTSGSTGRPKGVLHTHANIVDSAVLHAENVALRTEDRVSMLYSYTSSAGLKVDVVSALVTGARVCLYDVRSQGIGGLARWMREKNITVYHSVPEVFRAFCAFLEEGETIPSVRWVQLGGAQVRWHDYDLFRKHFGPRCQFANGLGATETGRISLHVVSKDSIRYSENIPVGAAVESVEVRLVGEDGQDIRNSDSGEMVVSTPHMASGYWRDPELTASAFRSGHDGQRWYFTGDLARRTGDGMFELLGRKGLVVNVNGNRVNVAEVEDALKLLDEVEDVAVAAHEVSGDVELTAYVISKTSDGDLRGLRHALTTMLPSYMIPTTLLRVDALPMTPSGKLNRSALPESTERVVSEHATENTSDMELQSTLASIWCDVLGIDQVSGDDDFLDLGGGSLRAMRVVAEIEKRVGVTMPVGRLFEAENFRAFVKMVGEADTA